MLAEILRWSDILRGYNNSTPGNGGRRNIVRYNSPTVAGFTASASWGEDDVWDTTLAYIGGFGDFTVNGRAGYGHSSDGVSTPCHTVPIIRRQWRLFLVGRFGLRSA